MPSSLFQNQQKNQMMNNPMQLIGEFKKFLSSGITPQKAEEIINEKIKNGEIIVGEKAKRQALVNKDTILSIVKADEKISQALDGKSIVKEIVIPGKIINIVVK